MARASGKAAATTRPDPEALLEAALTIAEEAGFDNLRLHQVADRTGTTLAEVGAVFNDVDAIANAWFGRGRAAVLATEKAELEGLKAEERLHLVMMRWFDRMAPYRRLTVEMLRTKTHPSHPHHWVPMVFDLSRLIHHFLDAARIEGRGLFRATEEVGLTALFLATLRVWGRDDSPDQAATRRYLERRLAGADRLLARWPARRR